MKHVMCLRILPNGDEEVLDILPYHPEYEALHEHFSVAQLNFWVNGIFKIAFTHLKNPDVEVLKNRNGALDGEKPNFKARQLAQAEYQIYGPALFILLTK